MVHRRPGVFWTESGRMALRKNQALQLGQAPSASLRAGCLPTLPHAGMPCAFWGAHAPGEPGVDPPSEALQCALPRASPSSPSPQSCLHTTLPLALPSPASEKLCVLCI